MNNPKNTISAMVTGGFLIVLTGCASFQGKQLQPVKQFPQTQAKMSVNIDVAYAALFNGERTTMFQKAAENSFENSCIKRMNKSGMFGEVSRELANPDLKVQISLVDEGEGDLGEAFLTGLTLYIFPSSATDTLHLRAKVIDMQTGLRRDIQLTDSVTMWQQIFLLPLLPFKSPPYEVNKCVNIMFDNLCVEIYRTGMLEEPALK